jgi:hypothetical protein
VMVGIIRGTVCLSIIFNKQTLQAASRGNSEG